MIPNVPTYYLCNYAKTKITFNENSEILLKLKSEKRINEEEFKQGCVQGKFVYFQVGGTPYPNSLHKDFAFIFEADCAGFSNNIILSEFPDCVVFFDKKDITSIEIMIHE
jgi:hypothetical protein